MSHSRWPLEFVEIGVQGFRGFTETKILELERRGFGEFGYNDVFIELVDVEFRFCNDTDIHVSFDQHQPLIEEFYNRWDALGYRPAEWLKTEKHGPGECVRGGEKNA